MMTTMKGFGLVAVVLVAAACGGQPAPAPTHAPPPAPATLTSVEVSPALATIHKGLGADLKATAIYSNGAKRDVTAQAVFTSDDAAVAAVAGARVTSLVQGVARISATWQGRSGSATITVDDAVLVRIDVTGTAMTMPKGASLRLQAFGTYSDGSTPEVTGFVSWGSPEGTVAFVEPGKAKGIAVGAATAVASLGPVESAPYGLSVTAAELMAVRMDAPTHNLPVGLTDAVAAVATFTDGEVDVTSDASLVTSDPSLLRLAPNGAVTALAPGEVDVSASYQGVTAQGRVVVSPAEVLSLRVALAGNDQAAVIGVGSAYQFDAFGTFTDGNEYRVTPSITWSASDGAVAAVSNALGSEGLATGLAAGATDIVASIPGSTVTASASLTVNAVADLVGITLSSDAFDPQSFAPKMLLALGQTGTVVVTGHYSDSSTRDLTLDPNMVWEDWSGGLLAVSPGQITDLGLTTTGSVYVAYVDPTGKVLASATIPVKVK